MKTLQLLNEFKIHEEIDLITSIGKEHGLSNSFSLLLKLRKLSVNCFIQDFGSANYL